MILIPGGPRTTTYSVNSHLSDSGQYSRQGVAHPTVLSRRRGSESSEPYDSDSERDCRRNTPVSRRQPIRSVQFSSDKMDYPTPEQIASFPEFTGNDISLTEYIKRFNRILSSMGLSAAMAYRILPVKLVDRAGMLYSEIEKENKVHDYQSLQNELLRRLTTDTS